MDINQKIKFEFLWIIITFVIIVIFLLPIYLEIGDAYPFYIQNSLVIFIAITFGRYLFLLKYHWITYSKWFKLFLVFFPIGVFMFLIDSFHEFQRFFDEQGIRSIMPGVSLERQNHLAFFIRSEMILFWSTAFLSNLLLPFKMTRSIYRKKKKGVD